MAIAAGVDWAKLLDIVKELLEKLAPELPPFPPLQFEGDGTIEFAIHPQGISKVTLTTSKIGNYVYGVEFTATKTAEVPGP